MAICFVKIKFIVLNILLERVLIVKNLLKLTLIPNENLSKNLDVQKNHYYYSF